MDGDSRNPRVSLLRKYDIPVEHLSYEYVEGCKSKKELERILRILRSGEEGVYPDLIKFTEKQLEELAPESRVLRVETPVLTKDGLPSEEWKEVEKDLLSWESEMKVMDKTLEFEKQRFDKVSDKNLPEVRKAAATQPKKLNVHQEGKKVKIETNLQNERIRSGDYASWDKYDVDTELLKLDVEEERKAEEIAKKKRELEKKKVQQEKKVEVINTDVKKDSYSSMEQQVLANQAKDRGNECFKSGDMNNALKYYSISIKFHPTAIALNNRAMTYIKLQKYQEALNDCNEVLKLEPRNVKALHRRSTAFQNIPTGGNNELALQDLNRIILLEPNNKVAQADLQALKKKLNIADTGPRFRMSIQETSDHRETRQQVGMEERRVRSCWNLGTSESVDKLPLTYYGPSTSAFQCEPQSVTHRMLVGPSLTGRVMCKCNSNTPRQNPLCQNCGEKLCRSKPVVKPAPKIKSENQPSNIKTSSAAKNSILKKKESPVEAIVKEPNEKSKIEINARNERSKLNEAAAKPVSEEQKSKMEINNANEKSKMASKNHNKNLDSNENGNKEDLITKARNEKFKADLDDYINSKFESKPKRKNIGNRNIDLERDAYITEIVEEEDSPPNNDDNNSNSSSQLIQIKITEVGSNEPQPVVEVASEKNESVINDVGSGDQPSKVSKKGEADEKKIPAEKEALDDKLATGDMSANGVKKKDEPKKEEEEPEKVDQTPEKIKDSDANEKKADIDNQSLPSTSSQPQINTESKKHKNKNKNRKKKQRERRENLDLRMNCVEPVRITQAPKYIKPTSVEPKVQMETTKDVRHEIKTETSSTFKNFVPNRKCVSTEGGVLKSNCSSYRSDSNILDNRLETQQLKSESNMEKIRNEINTEGNKENIKSCSSGNEERSCTDYLESAYEFFKKWEALKKVDESYAKRAEVMRRVRPVDLSRVIGNKLDSEMLKTILECLEKQFVETEPKIVVEFLKYIPQVPRFGIVSMFMDETEKKLIERLVESTENKGFQLEADTKKALTIIF